MSLQELLCRYRFLLVWTSSIRNLVATLFLFVSADLSHSSYVLLRHAVFCRDIVLLLYSVLCVSIEEILS